MRQTVMGSTTWLEVSLSGRLIGFPVLTIPTMLAHHTEIPWVRDTPAASRIWLYTVRMPSWVIWIWSALPIAARAILGGIRVEFAVCARRSPVGLAHDFRDVVGESSRSQ